MYAKYISISLYIYLHTDRLGSGSAVTDGMGEAVHVLGYMPYGETLLDLSQGDETPYQFTGYEKDQETGFHYAEARYYESHLSTFNSTDPMWHKYPSLSPYAYCANNPLRYVDPSGESGELVYDHKAKTVTIHSKLYFYGSEATKERSKIIANGIAANWNSANAKIDVRGKEYSIKFAISYETVTEEKAIELAANNTSARNNFIRVERGGKESSGTYSYKDIYGSNSFWFNIDDGLNSTTFSHEYGHGLGLEHPTEDLSRATSRPHIMIPRNTPYGRYWSIKKGENNYIVNPNSRRVTSSQVSEAIRNYNGGMVTNKIYNE